MQRVRPIVDEVWPSEVPLEGFTISFGQTGIVLNVTYSGRRALDGTSIGILQRNLREKLDSATLTLNVKRVSPARHRPDEK